MHNSPHLQRGTVIVTAALFLLFLLGMMGIALDFGRLFVVKAELQTAMDSCALAAAQELDGSSTALTRAASAGRTAANLNWVHFQAESPGVVTTEVEFSDTLLGSYSPTFSPATSARYVRCNHARTGLAPWLLQALTGFWPDNASYAQSQSVAAMAVATRTPSQTNCILPVAICPKPGGGSYTPGQWIQGVTNDSEDVTSGQFRWVDLSGNGGGAREIKDILGGAGACGLPGTSTKLDVAKTGKTNGAVSAWNTRFGIYKGRLSAANNPPDRTGYAWYVDTADVNGAPVPSTVQGRYAAADGYQSRASLNSPYQGDNKTDDAGLKQVQGSASSSAAHAAGMSRRIVTMPVVDSCTAGSMNVTGFACVLLLHPLQTNASGKTSKMWVEYIGDASATAGNPCATSGMPGGATASVRVPALVR